MPSKIPGLFLGLNLLNIRGHINQFGTEYQMDLTKWRNLLELKLYLVGTVDAGGLVLRYRDISSHGAEYAPMSLQLFMN